MAIRLNSVILVSLIGAWSLLGCGHPSELPQPYQTSPSVPPRKLSSPATIAKLDHPGLHNLYRLNDWLYSGSSPESPEGFQSLRDLKVKTIISVDGARPDVEAAGKFGLRYVHLPIGYAGIAPVTTRQLIKAAQTLPRPLYIHCHHGKHRGPAAAGQILRCTDRACTASDAVAILKTLGTDPKYRGLYEAVESLEVPTPAELDAVESAFPETAEIPRLAEIMVQIDLQWDALKERQAADWMNSTQSDIDKWIAPAVLLIEHFREAARLSDMETRPDEFRKLLQSAEKEGAELERLLREHSESPGVRAKLDAAFTKSAQICSKCHAEFRDLPQTPK